MAARYMAAAIIAAPDFPKRARMPKLLPPPFTNFGHQILFDYQMLVQMVWQVATAIATCMWEKRRAWNRRRRAVTAVTVGVAVLGGLYMGLVYSVAAAIAGLLIVAFLYFIGARLFRDMAFARYRWDLTSSIATIRAQALEALMQDKLVIGGDVPQVPSELIGNGGLGGERVPVVTVVKDSQPFSGYGQLRTQKLFVCRPKDDEADRCSMVVLDERVRERITAKVRELDLPETAFGPVVVVHGESLAMDSPWLDANKAPCLWLHRGYLPRVYQIDPRASVRVYFAIQIVFPQHMTAATFFVRLFSPGSGAAFQIAVTTMGPPRVGRDDLAMRLCKHEMERRGWVGRGIWHGGTPAEREGLSNLNKIGDSSESAPPFQNAVDEYSIAEIHAYGELMRGSQYSQRFDQLATLCTMWPGHLLGKSANWREAHSLMFPADFFGRPELLASVRTVYDQLARAILDTLDENGLDISDYRDSEGRYAIHAETIEQLVVGERVHLDSSKPSEPGATPAPESVVGAHEAAA
jgi:hypothetical protein